MICNKCKKEKEQNDFPFIKRKNSYRRTCKSCIAEQTRTCQINNKSSNCDPFYNL